ncbi:MAG: hypothetical protein KAS32_02005, partial [Candidatus Peribacteraceae bacterium]|nr:hypothetical protein [Candidatus Peribacteraceae bacterium]
MSFELLDTILESSIAKEAEVETPFVAEDADIYGGLDSLVEDAMRDSLRFTVMESAIDSDTKIEHLGLVESAAFTQDQMLKFMEDSIHPVLEMAGVFEEGVEDAFSVHPAIYELALTLALNESDALPNVETIYMEAAEAFLDEMTAEDGVVNDKKDQMSTAKYYGEKDGEGDDKDATEREGDDESEGENTPAIKEGASLYDTILAESAVESTETDTVEEGAEEETTKDTNLAEHILDIFESYDISDDDVRREMLEVASELYAEVGMESLSISVLDSAELFAESSMREGVINLVDLDESGEVVEESISIDDETPYLTVRFLEGQLNLLEAKKADKKNLTKVMKERIAKAKAKMKGAGTRSYGAIGGKAAAAKFKLGQKVKRYKGVASAAGAGSGMEKAKAVGKAMGADVKRKVASTAKGAKTKAVAAVKAAKFKASQVPEKLAKRAA